MKDIYQQAPFDTQLDRDQVQQTYDDIVKGIRHYHGSKHTCDICGNFDWGTAQYICAVCLTKDKLKDR